MKFNWLSQAGVLHIEVVLMAGWTATYDKFILHYTTHKHTSAKRK